jgi:hypothetical protein
VLDARRVDGSFRLARSNEEVRAFLRVAHLDTVFAISERPAQQHPGPEQPLRAHQHEGVLDDGCPGAAHLARQALRQPAVRRPVPDLYLTVLAAARAASPAWLESEITRACQQVRQAALDDPVAPFSNPEFEQDGQAMIEFARARGAFVVADVQRRR